MELNKYDIALSRMVGVSTPEWCKKPRPYDGYIYATDRHLLLRIKQSLCNGEYEANPFQPKDISKCFPKADTKLLLDIHKVAEIIKRLEPTETVFVCGECGGDGRVSWTYEDRDGEEYSEMGDCPVCNGTGKVEAEAEVREQNIEINGDWFNIGNLMCLLDTIHNLGFDKVIVERVGNYRAMRIKVSEDIDALIMSNKNCAPTGKLNLKSAE